MYILCVSNYTMHEYVRKQPFIYFSIDYIAKVKKDFVCVLQSAKSN